MAALDGPAALNGLLEKPNARAERHARPAPGEEPPAPLALFDDEKRAGEVLGLLNKQGKEVADTSRAVNEGSHEALPGSMVDLVRSAERLAGWLQRLPWHPPRPSPWLGNFSTGPTPGPPAS